MIERVLTNLIENALRFTPRGGAVRWRFEGGPRMRRQPGRKRSRSLSRTRERDHAGGSAAHLRALLPRGQEPGPASTGGAGLGLAIRARSSSCTEAPGGGQPSREGARFSFVLPAHAAGEAGAVRQA